MLAPPYQQPPGASTTNHYTACTHCTRGGGGAESTAVCFTGGKSHFLICRDRRLDVHARPRSDPSAGSDWRPAELQDGNSTLTSEGRWENAMGPISKRGDYEGDDEGVISCSFARLVGEAEWVDEADWCVRLKGLGGSFPSLLLLIWVCVRSAESFSCGELQRLSTESTFCCMETINDADSWQ